SEWSKYLRNFSRQKKSNNYISWYVHSRLPFNRFVHHNGDSSTSFNGYFYICTQSELCCYITSCVYRSSSNDARYSCRRENASDLRADFKLIVVRVVVVLNRYG